MNSVGLVRSVEGEEAGHLVQLEEMGWLGYLCLEALPDHHRCMFA